MQFFHSIWRNLHLTENFYTAPPVVPMTNMRYAPLQALDGKFGDGKSEAHGKYSAKEGVRPNQARPQTNIQVRWPHWGLVHRNFFSLHLIVQPTGRAEGESETQDRHLWNQFGRFAPRQKCKLKRKKLSRRKHSLSYLVCHDTKPRFSAKEGATRPDQARPRTNIQVF